jgi:hypothetical protein
MRYPIAAIVTALACELLVGTAHGQGVSTYRPATPTVSPYMNLLRTDLGPLPNYQSLVRPQLEQRTFNRQAAQAINRTERDFRTLAQTPAAAAPLQPGRLGVRTPQTRPTGVAGQFQFFSHYFPPPRTVMPRR